MKNKRTSKIIIAMLLCLSIVTLGFREEVEIDQDDKKVEERSLFSWNYKVMLGGRAQLFKTMESTNLNTLYQEFSKDLKPEDIDSFLVEAKDRNIEVSLLAGSAEWALDRDGKAMIETVDRVIKINKSLNKSDGIKSILFDVEPYILEEWNEKSKKNIMNDFVRAMKITYKKAHKHNIEVIVCIPFYYDKIGLNKQLDNLIKTGSDSIAIMNYFKTNEANNIKNEVNLADKYGKRVINIYELQRPGIYGLEEKNTYHHQGIEAVEKSFDKIKQEFLGKDVSISFHEYNSLRDILARK